MRDILVLLIGLGLAGAAFKRPLYGGLGWVLFSVMNPHRLAYGFAYDFPFATLMVGTTLLGMLVRREEVKLKGGAAAVLLLLFSLWMVVTTFNAFHPENAFDYLERTAKSFLMTMVLLLLINSRRDILLLVSTLVASLGFYGVKGGLFVLATGGSHRVNGPADSVMAGNNALGVGLTMCIPLLYYVYTQAGERRLLRQGLVVAMVLCAVAVLGTYSRGALLAVAAMGVVLWTRSRSKLPIAIVFAAFLAVAIPNMPDQWTDRMNTISTHEEDESAMGRIYAWQTATNIALDRFPVAGGFEWHGKETSARYSPRPDIVLVAHSIYFQTLGSQGFIGLALFLSFWSLVFWQCGWLRRQSKGRPDRLWAHHLGSMVQVALVGYAVGGAFLDLAFWDLPYYLFTAIGGAVYLLHRENAAAAVQVRPTAAAGVVAGSGATSSNQQVTALGRP